MIGFYFKVANPSNMVVLIGIMKGKVTGKKEIDLRYLAFDFFSSNTYDLLFPKYSLRLES